MGKLEKYWQDLVCNDPKLISEGIPDLSEEFNKGVEYKLISLGTEISTPSGLIDNLFIDSSGIITIVECKRFCNQEIKREVYSQILNYASQITYNLRNNLSDATTKCTMRKLLKHLNNKFTAIP